jgi:DNA-binding GntR family transcriptional regulator
MQTMDHIYDQNHRLRILSGKLIIKRLGDSHLEHLQIIENLLNKNFDEAANAMQDHLNKSKQAALKVLLSNGSCL